MGASQLKEINGSSLIESPIFMEKLNEMAIKKIEMQKLIATYTRSH